MASCRWVCISMPRAQTRAPRSHDTDKNDWRLFRLDRTTDALPTGLRVPSRPVPGDDPAAFVASRLSAAPTRYRAIATVQAPADRIRARGLAGRLQRLTDTTCRVDASDDHLPRIAQTLAGLEADYTLEGDPAVLHHLRTTAQRTLRAITR